jgi:hypothetical protein
MLTIGEACRIAWIKKTKAASDQLISYFIHISRRKFHPGSRILQAANVAAVAPKE